MHRWPRSRKRLLLAFTLLPAPLMIGFALAIGLAFEGEGAGGGQIDVALGLWVAAPA